MKSGATADSSTSRWRRLLLKGTVVLSLAWLIFAQWLVWPGFGAQGFANRDAAAYAAIGEILIGGGTPYVDYWDHKPPLIHIINATALGGTGGEAWGIWLAGGVVLLLSCVLCARLLREHFRPLIAAVGVASFALAAPVLLDGGNLTEQYYLPLQWLMLICAIRGRTAERSSTAGMPMVLGALGGLGFLLRPNLIGTFLVAALVLNSRLGRDEGWSLSLRGASWTITGFSLPIVLTGAWLFQHGAVGPAVDQVFVYNFKYIETTMANRLAAAGSGLFAAFGPAIVVSVAGLAAAAHRLLRRESTTSTRPLAAVVVLLLPAELVAASLSGRAYAHYFMTLLPGLLLAACYAVARGVELVESTGKRGPGVRTLTAMCSAAVPVVVGVHAAQLLKIRKHYSEERVSQVSSTRAYLTRAGLEGEIFVWGSEPDLYLGADYRPASPYIYVFPLLVDGYGERVADRLLATLRTRRPKIVVDASASNDRIPSLDRCAASSSREARQGVIGRKLGAVCDFVRGSYRPVRRIGTGRWRWEIRVRE